MTSKLIGKWLNQNASELTITTADEAKFTGSFRSTKGRATRNNVYPVSGIVNGDLLSFCVDFRLAQENLYSLATFSGRYVTSERPTIHTLWIVARQFEDSEKLRPTQLWNTFLTNSDVFTYSLD